MVDGELNSQDESAICTYYLHSDCKNDSDHNECVKLEENIDNEKVNLQCKNVDSPLFFVPSNYSLSSSSSSSLLTMSSAPLVSLIRRATTPPSTSPCTDNKKISVPSIIVSPYTANVEDESATIEKPIPEYVLPEKALCVAEIESCAAIDKKKVKTVLCVNYMRYGTCKFSSHCAFAHGFSELRPPVNEKTEFGKFITCNLTSEERNEAEDSSRRCEVIEKINIGNNYNKHNCCTVNECTCTEILPPRYAKSIDRERPPSDNVSVTTIDELSKQEAKNVARTLCLSPPHSSNAAANNELSMESLSLSSEQTNFNALSVSNLQIPTTTTFIPSSIYHSVLIPHSSNHFNEMNGTSFDRERSVKNNSINYWEECNGTLHACQEYCTLHDKETNARNHCNHVSSRKLSDESITKFSVNERKLEEKNVEAKDKLSVLKLTDCDCQNKMLSKNQHLKDMEQVFSKKQQKRRRGKRSTKSMKLLNFCSSDKEQSYQTCLCDESSFLTASLTLNKQDKFYQHNINNKSNNNNNVNNENSNNTAHNDKHHNRCWEENAKINNVEECCRENIPFNNWYTADYFLGNNLMELARKGKNESEMLNTSVASQNNLNDTISRTQTNTNSWNTSLKEVRELRHNQDTYCKCCECKKNTDKEIEATCASNNFVLPITNAKTFIDVIGAEENVQNVQGMCDKHLLSTKPTINGNSGSAHRECQCKTFSLDENRNVIVYYGRPQKTRNKF